MEILEFITAIIVTILICLTVLIIFINNSENKKTEVELEKLKQKNASLKDIIVKNEYDKNILKNQKNKKSNVTNNVTNKGVK